MDTQIIRQWYREMAQRHHPDHGGSADAMAAITAAYERLRELIGESPEDSEATAENALVAAGGWWAVSPTAVKLWATLWRIGPSGHTTYRDLSRLSGIGQRTVPGALKELKALCWVESLTSRGQGLWYQVKQPPVILQQSAADYYGAAIQQQRDRLEQRENRINREMSGARKRASG